MRLHDYLQPQRVVLDLRARGVRDTIQALVRCLAEQEALPDAAVIEEALLAREADHTTALGHGVAVPHATVEGLERPLIMVAVAPDGVPFGPLGLDPVRVFFLLLSPPDRRGLHIKLLARICRLVRHPGSVARLVGADSASELLDQLVQIDAEHV